MRKFSYYKLSPQIYDDQFWWKKDDIEFWKNILLPLDNSILEIAAGTGRLALPLVREQYNYEGLELSNDYCSFANQKLKKYSDKKLIKQADMRTFNFKKKYDKIFIPFNSLLHLLNERDFILALKCIKKHMHFNSKLYIDIFVPHPFILNQEKDQLEHRGEFFNSITKQETIIKESLEYDKNNEIMHVNWFYESDGKIYNQFSFDMKTYYPDSINRILIEQGFNILNFWGDYQKSEFTEESNLQIYKCELANEK